MKQKIILIAVFLITISAQASDFGFGVISHPTSISIEIIDENYIHEGDLVVSLGEGYPNLSILFFTLYTARQDFRMVGTGPFHAKLEYFINDEFGFGLNINNSSSKGTWIQQSGIHEYHESLEYFSTSFNARFNWHFYNNKGFDFYIGPGFGYKYTTYTYTSENPMGNNKVDVGRFPIAFEITTGGRYFFTDMFGVYVEIGLAKSLIQGGLSVKF